MPAPLKAKPSVICDWLELSVLANQDYPYRLSSLKRYRDTHRESEYSDSEGNHSREENTDTQGINGADDDVFLDAITEEIADRETALSGCYPFETDSSGYKLSLKDNLSDGAYIYIFCLLLSNSKTDNILDGKWLPDIDHTTRDLFQVCATMAAAGEVAGSAISFGWPRPNDNPPFLQKLKEVYRHLGEGVVVTEARAGVSPSPKDEEIDIIAWRPSFDKVAGQVYLLGQVASGDNWQAKSILGGPIRKFHENWFTRQPASIAIPSIFIPHDIQSIRNGSRYDLMHAETPCYGTILDRLRLPRRASEGINLADNHHNLTIERRGEIPNVILWVKNQLSNLRTIYLASTNA